MMWAKVNTTILLKSLLRAIVTMMLALFITTACIHLTRLDIRTVIIQYGCVYILLPVFIEVIDLSHILCERPIVKVTVHPK